MITLYTAAAPNGRKASIALEELGLDYAVERLNLQEEDQFQQEFLALNPNNKIPVLRDGDLTIWESGAILLYLGETYGLGKILPEDPARRIEAIQYTFFQTGGVGPNLGRLGSQLMKPEEERNAEMVEIFSGEMKRLLGVLDRILSDGRPYLAGDYSIGDIMHFPWLFLPLKLGIPMLTEQKRVVAWLERIAERPAVEKGMAVPE